ncbi:hypothetical protein [Paenimyroides viscosum]|uniref:Uncharacterized protein n=1 Tax=Paenimyroides viscosum TaxID=2488729 RepID=A0A3P1B2T4_9FLAO|nr:hypothetical protein [Paenimyroides viscosum]RRA94883.1 hypothetical protein EG242_07635 [Paenimyroides viscosum]
MKVNKQIVIEIVNNLIDVRNKIFDQIVALGMETEFSEEVGGFTVGEMYHLELKHFEDSKNSSLRKLVELCRETEGTIFSLMNFNGIDEKEVKLNN